MTYPRFLTPRLLEAAQDTPLLLGCVHLSQPKNK
jgi:hypothetical protein